MSGWAAPAVSSAVRAGQDRSCSQSVSRASRVVEVRREQRRSVGTSAVRAARAETRDFLHLWEGPRLSRMRAACESGGALFWRSPTTA